MSKGLEDTIIAYFDGELSDADSAELLHRVSVSPEIRTLFREHEQLHNAAREAGHSLVISPEIEESIFSRIETLAGNRERKKAIWVFSRRTAVALAFALILISGSLGYFLPKLFSENGPSAMNNSGKLQNIAQAENSVDKPAGPADNQTGKKVYTSYRTRSVSTTGRDAGETAIAGEPVSEQTPALATEIRTVYPVRPRSEDIISNIGSDRHNPFDRVHYPEESRQLFDVSLQTSSGFTYPGDVSGVKPFADQRLSVAYHLTENNLVGIRIVSGLYQQLSAPSTVSANGAFYVIRNLETIRSFGEEAYLSHLFPISIGAPFFLELSADAGIIPNGYSYGAEAGIRIPISENIMFNGAFALLRVHSNAPSGDQLLSTEIAGKPVILSASDIHTTLNGRLYYGLLYRF